MRRGWKSITTLAAAATLATSSFVAAQAPKPEITKRAVPAKAETRVEIMVREELRKIAVPQAPVNAAERQKLIARQLIQQLRPSLGVEYHLLVKACDPTAEQRRLIARAGERALRQIAERGGGALNTVVVFNDGNRKVVRQQRADPAQTIRDALAGAAGRCLSAEQAARYKHELECRREHWKDTAIGAIVSRIDEDLLLTAQQRTAIAKSLRDHWNDAWAPNLTTLVNLQHYFPPIPDDVIVELLDEPQAKAWKDSQATRRYAVLNRGVAGVEGDFDDEALAEARAADDQALASDEP